MSGYLLVGCTLLEKTTDRAFKIVGHYPMTYDTIGPVSVHGRYVHAVLPILTRRFLGAVYGILVHDNCIYRKILLNSPNVSDYAQHRLDQYIILLI